jgi:two-component system NarL family sensor kinase
VKQLLFIIALAIVNAAPVSGQTPWAIKRDSLLNALSRAKEDTFKVWTMLRLGELYLNIQNDSVAWYAKAFGQLSAKLNFPIGKAYSLNMQALVLSSQFKLDEAIAMDLAAIDMLKDTRRRKVLANIYNNTALVYGSKGDEPACIDAYLKAEAIYEQLDDSSNLALVYGNLGSAYIMLREYDKAYAWSLKGITLSRSLHEDRSLPAALLNLASALVNLQRFDTALVLLIQVRDLERITSGKPTNPQILSLMGAAYIGMGKFDLLKTNSVELMALARTTNDDGALCYALSGFVDYYLHQTRYGKAMSLAKQYIEAAGRSKDHMQLRYAYNQAAHVEMEMGKMDMGDYYSALRDSIDDLIRSDRILQNTQELEAKYSLNKKQAEIDQLNQQQEIQQLTLRQRNIVNWALAAAVFVAILVGLLYRRNYRQKKKLLETGTLLQQQRITELEQERQLLAARAVVQGQVEERTRLAKDLHDGLGSILSSAKFSFTNMKERLIITPDNAAAFEKGMDMLDKSISELRRVAHNLMPEALTRFGLDTALKDFCNSVDQSGALRLTYQSFGLHETVIPDVVSAAVYRIIQELVNNILKHADATTALVQLIRNNDALTIAVEDNGKGFDPAILENNTGMGYLSLRNRVAYLKGTIDIQTAAGKGTSINIEIPNISA